MTRHERRRVQHEDTSPPRTWSRNTLRMIKKVSSIRTLRDVTLILRRMICASKDQFPRNARRGTPTRESHMQRARTASLAVKHHLPTWAKTMADRPTDTSSSKPNSTCFWSIGAESLAMAKDLIRNHANTEYTVGGVRHSEQGIPRESVQLTMCHVKVHR